MQQRLLHKISTVVSHSEERNFNVSVSRLFKYQAPARPSSQKTSRPECDVLSTALLEIHCYF